MTVPGPGPRPADPRSHPPDPVGAVVGAMTGLDGLADRPLAEHADVFERVHAALAGALAAGSV